MTEPAKLPVKTETTSKATASSSALENLRREIDNVFDNFRLGTWPFPFAHPAMAEFKLPWMREGMWNLTPAVDITEKENEYAISVELPGMDETEIEVKLANGMLVIQGEKKEEKEEQEKDHYLSERRYGSFMRSFEVPEGVDTSMIDATFAKGILAIKLPKAADAHKNEQKIAIKSS